MGICTTEFQFSSCVVEKSKRQNFGKTFRTHGGLLYIVFAKWFKLCSGPCEVENQDSILWNRVYWAILKILNENSEKPQQKVNVVFFYKYIFEFHEIWRVLNFSIAPSQLLLMWTFLSSVLIGWLYFQEERSKQFPPLNKHTRVHSSVLVLLSYTFTGTR